MSNVSGGLSSVRDADTLKSQLDPDDLFARHGIAEVRAFQERLRADANAKQEELRLMVGERYRDLLQASTSILDISRASKRVSEALDETKITIIAQDHPSTPRKNAFSGESDAHLDALQMLSAHMKLLLDAPEYLWRLIEKKQFFDASWLFLLSRVVHRALVREEDRDEGTWSTYGLNILEQFPIVQRQWESISQFRSQIVHKATLSLRDSSTSPEDSCSAVLAIHLLDSKPISSTLSVLLEQRTKSLHTLLEKSRIGAEAESLGPSTSLDVFAPEETKPSLSAIRQAVVDCLDAISHTVKTCRLNYIGFHSSKPLVRIVLEYIHSEKAGDDIPADSQLSTQSLLSALPSSTHLLLLPLELKSYRPYVDLDSSSTSLRQEHVGQVLREWLDLSLRRLNKSLTSWLNDLHQVKDVWAVRGAMQKWISVSSELDQDENTRVKDLFDLACRTRINEIWGGQLLEAHAAFRNILGEAVASFNGAEDQAASPIRFLFQSPTLSEVPSIDAAFPKYRATLHQQLLGRTSQLDEILKSLETCAKSLQQDLTQVIAGERADVATLADDIKSAALENIAALCAGVVDTLRTQANDINDSEVYIPNLLLVGRIARELSTSASSFISDIPCDEAIRHDFIQKTNEVHEHTLNRWRTATAARVSEDYIKMLRPSGGSDSSSSSLIRCLSSLCEALQQLGLIRDAECRSAITGQLLRAFIVDILLRPWVSEPMQSLRDIAFLRALVRLQQGTWQDVDKKLDEKEQEIGVADSAPIDFTEETRQYLLRTQMLFSLLLPAHAIAQDKKTQKSLLFLGQPQVEKEFRPVMEFAKPSIRFGLLLVDSR